MILKIPGVEWINPLEHPPEGTIPELRGPGVVCAL